MARIGSETSPHLAPAPAGAAELPRGVEMLQIMPRPARPMRIISRQPPVLRWLRARLSNDSTIDALFAAEIAKPDGLDTAERAYRLADFLLRHFDALQHEAEAVPGLEILADMARMYEHLLLLQDLQEAV